MPSYGLEMKVSNILDRNRSRCLIFELANRQTNVNEDVKMHESISDRTHSRWRSMFRYTVTQEIAQRIIPSINMAMHIVNSASMQISLYIYMCLRTPPRIINLFQMNCSYTIGHRFLCGSLLLFVRSIENSVNL